MYNHFFVVRCASQVMPHLVLSAARPTASLWRLSQLRRVISRWCNRVSAGQAGKKEKYIEKVYLGEFIMNKMSLLFVLFEWGLCESCLSSWEISVTFTYSQCFTVACSYKHAMWMLFHSVMCQFVRREIVLRAVHTAGPSWALLWAGRTVGKDSTVLSVTNSMKVSLAWPTVFLNFRLKLCTYVLPSLLKHILFLIVPWQNYQPTNQGRRCRLWKKTWAQSWLIWDPGKTDGQEWHGFVWT